MAVTRLWLRRHGEQWGMIKCCGECLHKPDLPFLFRFIITLYSTTTYSHILQLLKWWLISSSMKSMFKLAFIGLVCLLVILCTMSSSWNYFQNYIHMYLVKKNPVKFSSIQTCLCHSTCEVKVYLKLDKALGERRPLCRDRSLTPPLTPSTRFVAAWQYAVMNVGPWWWKASPKASGSVLSHWSVHVTTMIEFFAHLYI